MLTGVAGVLLAGRVNGVTPGSQGQLLELDVITAVVIGGTSLLGGRGSVVGTMLGALVFGTLANGMNLLGVDSNWQLICKGLILMTAVLFDVLSKNGRALYRDGKVQTLDEKSLRAEARERAAAILRRAGLSNRGR